MRNGRHKQKVEKPGCNETPKAHAECFDALRDKQLDSTHRFDIFLSHSHVDEAACFALYNRLVELGREVRGRPFEVYLDKLFDVVPPGEVVTSRNAYRLQRRITQSDYLVFAFSNNARKSKWMPWELGFFDALIGQERICVHPLPKKDGIDFSSFEYLQLYKLVDDGELEDFFRQAYADKQHSELREARQTGTSEFPKSLLELMNTSFGSIDWGKINRKQLEEIEQIYDQGVKDATTGATIAPNVGLGDDRLGKVPALDRYFDMTAVDIKKKLRADPVNAPFAIWLKGAEFWADWLAHMVNVPSDDRPAALGDDRLGKAEGLDRHLQMTADDIKQRMQADPITAPFAIYGRAAEFWRDWFVAMFQNESNGRDHGDQ